jgi:hypothetical protein
MVAERRKLHLLRDPIPIATSISFPGHGSLTKRVEDDRLVSCRNTIAEELQMRTLLGEMHDLLNLPKSTACQQQQAARKKRKRPKAQWT